MHMSLAPIALFGYKRPEHLTRTLAALQASPLARASKLHVFSDGPKHSEDRLAVEQVRALVRKIKGFAQVLVHERVGNLGLAQSVIKGVTELSRTYGRVIVLEDDLVVASGFLTFMNQALEHYRDVSQVMQVSGHMFPIPQAVELGDTFFCRKPASWGWATWGRAWAHYNPDSESMIEQISSAARQYEFDVDGSYPYFDMLQQQAAGKMDVWGVCWYASMFLKGGVCLYPTQSLVSNIGMDGSGTHCDPTTRFDVPLSEQMSWKLSMDVQESIQGLELLRRFALGVSAEETSTSRLSLLSWCKRVARKLYSFRWRIDA